MAQSHGMEYRDCDVGSYQAQTETPCSTPFPNNKNRWINMSNQVSVRWLSSFSLCLLISMMVIMSTGCSVFGGASVEEAPYQLVRKDNQFEIRDYAPLLVAETRVDASSGSAGNTAFRTLFNYISGENQGAEKIAMTAPVIAETDSGSSGETIAMTAPVIYQKDGEVWRYRFVLPKSYTLDSAPRPLNPKVELIEVEPKRVAVIRYNWLATDKARSKNAQALMDWLKSQDLVPQSELRWAGYNPPWTLPPFRRNEVLVDIEP